MRMTGGGIVFGGGEPLGQEYFIKECALYSQKTLPDIPLRIETSLQTSIENVQELLPYISSWIIDIKDLNPDIYYRYTHGQMDLMWNNLMYLVQHAPYGRILYGSGFPVSRDIIQIAISRRASAGFNLM